MIKKLKRKFTILASVSMLVLMTVLVSIIGIINYSSLITEVDDVLDVLSQPGAPFFDKKDHGGKPQKGDGNFVPHGMSPEVPYESRYFTVTIDAEGSIVDSNLTQILSVDESSVATYTEKAVSKSKQRGFVGEYRFLKIDRDGKTEIIFLDCGRKLDSFRGFLLTGYAVGLGGCVVVFIIFLFVAGLIAKPMVESHEKQKRFISDAGHEIKTPLTIIRANVDLLELEGEKEELSEIRSQVTRLTELTKDLVLLSKMEEDGHKLQKVECPLSDLVVETAQSFQAPFTAGGIEFLQNVEPGITITGAPGALRQLTSVLLENAIKYTPKGGFVSLELTAQKKSVVLSVKNSTAKPVKEADLPHLFERFYRTDASRNSSTGGHGIGLSIAKAITDAHGGSISASVPGENEFCITASLPV